MAKLIESVMVGIDVSKAELVIARSDSKSLETIANTPRAICRWLKTLPCGTSLAFEATGAYHRTLASLAHQAGFALYLLDDYRLNRYRDGIGNRAKTDPADARLILRYLSKELSELKPWVPPHEAFYRIQNYLGMDVRVRDSGKQVGRRKLTKKGDPELRRLLYNAAMSARRTMAWGSLYETYLSQGLKTTQALVKLARKLARIAFALMKK